MNKKNIDLIRQALGAAESSIKLAKQLLNDFESEKVGSSSTQSSESTKNLPGITGSFDGENMVTPSGETFPVPANYASKSMLVVGDTLKMVEEGKEKRFKQIEHVKRYRTTGIVTKKDGKWKAITPEGSYKVLPVTVEHLGADVGSEVLLHLPANNLTVAYAAIESIKDGNKVQAPEAEKTVKEKTESGSELPAKEVNKPHSEDNAAKGSPKPEIKTVVEAFAQKKEVVGEKNPKDSKQDDKPKVEEPKANVTTIKPEPAKTLPQEPKASVITIKPEPAKLTLGEPKVEPVVARETVTPAPKPAATIPPVVEPKPMEISPEEDELT